MGKHSHKSKKHKKHSKKAESNSSSEDEWVEALVHKQTKKPRRESSNDSGSYDRKKRKSKKKLKRSYSSSSSSSSDDEVTKKRINKSSDGQSCSKNSNIEMQTGDTREDWMSLSTSFSSFSNKDRIKQKEQEKKQQKEEDQYNPSKCSRELNPYWKNGGDGLPQFQKPKDDDLEDNSYRHNKTRSSYTKPRSGWRKSKSYFPDSKSDDSKSKDSITYSSKQNSKGSSQKEETSSVDEVPENKAMTEKELNLLAGRLVKAEIMGNDKLVKELKEQLERGRTAIADAKLQDEEVILTQTDRQGHSKPLTLQSEYKEVSGHKKQRKKALGTHTDKQRVRYFPDDDNFSLKQMFENEKFNSVKDQDSEFMKIASNIRKNDDLDDLFTDNVRRKKSDSKIDEASRSKAISEHRKVSDSLDNCPKCIQSSAMQKHLIISLGEYVYLSIPAHEPLLDGHCLIIPIRHVPSVTQLDENEWSEIRDFRKALVKLFDSKDQDPIFFEIATGFHRYPHMVLECVPLPKEEGCMAPIYFKKAIDESETEWAQNKKLVLLKNRDVRRAIPKGLAYFSVSFGMEEGFAHVIEDERLFPVNFAQEIIGGILDLHHSKWRKPLRQSFDVQSKRVLLFSNEWKKFDCTSTE